MQPRSQGLLPGSGEAWEKSALFLWIFLSLNAFFKLKMKKKGRKAIQF